MIYSDSCEAFWKQGGPRYILGKSEKTGRNYELAMKVKQNIIEWSQRNTNTEGRYIHHCTTGISTKYFIGVGKDVNVLKIVFA